MIAHTNNYKMQIIIPMSGFGERFKQAGYTLPKPLIEVDGKPIISYVIDMFPNETDFIFICNKEHIDHPDYAMRESINKYCPTGKIISIDPHKKGPIYAVLQAEKHIDLTMPTIVNYCDFTCYWDWSHFKKWVVTSECMGAIPAYRGFHPHSLGSTHYAYIRQNQHWMIDIQEKMPFTDDRMNEYASSGTYYFSSGKLMLDAFHDTIDNDRSINGEYYVSLAYKYLLKKYLPIAIYDLQHFMQWGTPSDLEEYKNWSTIFRHLQSSNALSAATKGALIIPMAGLGQRYIDAGYTTPKPLIPVSGSPMVLQATNDLPKANQQVFILRKNMPGLDSICQLLHDSYPHSIIKIIKNLTEGQACTALLGLAALEAEYNHIDEPLTIGACDNGAIYDPNKLEDLLNDDETDVIVWGVRKHPHAIHNPHMYGWLNVESTIIRSVSVKTPLNSPQTDPVIIGTFTFKRANDFKNSVNRMIKRNAKINGEFYIDTCINDAIELGLTCKLFEVDHFISWGTPNDLKTFEYWQSCFTKWDQHPYLLSNDSHMNKSILASLESRYKKTIPNILEKLS